jgi:hypothetical protein
MRKSVLILSAALLAGCAADAREGGGASASRTFQVGAFSSVSLAGPHNVVVQVGPAASVRAEGPEEEIERLEIEVRGGDLEIGTKKNSWKAGFNRDRKPVTIYVTTPSLAAADIAGSGDMRIDRVEGDRFAADTAGSGNMEIAALRVREADFSIAGSGNIKASGNAARTKVEIAGSGDVDIGALDARTASVSIVGSGNVRARASETADVEIMGSGDVTLAGSAKCSVSKMGSGSVRCGA